MGKGGSVDDGGVRGVMPSDGVEVSGGVGVTGESGVRGGFGSVGGRVESEGGVGWF